MANLIVRNIDEKVVDALKTQADKHGRSVEAEHHRVLEGALDFSTFKSCSRSLALRGNAYQRLDHAPTQEHGSEVVNLSHPITPVFS